MTFRFQRHLDLEGRHAFLSASKPHWINYSEEKFDNYFFTQMAAARGTELHEFAATAIRLRQKLKGTQQTLNRYVNDAIAYSMTPEVVLAYSPNAFGTADAISFKNGLLRIHDLKTGVSPAKMTQLEVYFAFFCLEYDVSPAKIKAELRIYQNDEVFVHVPELDTIVHIMDRIITYDERINQMRREALA